MYSPASQCRFNGRIAATYNKHAALKESMRIPKRGVHMREVFAWNAQSSRVICAAGGQYHSLGLNLPASPARFRHPNPVAATIDSFG